MTEALGDAGGSAVPDPGALTVGSGVTDGSGMDLGANELARGAEGADTMKVRLRSASVRCQAVRNVS
jgi:hypothetical protein